LVLLGLGVVLPAIGLWNPFNLVLVDLAFRHPWAGVMAVLVALSWLWLRHAPRSWIGGVGMVVLTLAIAIWLLAGVFFALFGLDETQPVEHLVAGPGHHVQD